MSDKRKYRRSKEEIAKQFDLPERKSKIATIMKQDGKVYCICRSSDCSRFMICCDGCEEWYHGDCINVSEKESKHIRQYYCQVCKKENPQLQTIFRVDKAKDSGGSHSNSDQDKRKINKDQQRFYYMEGCGNCEGCRITSCGTCDACRTRLPHNTMPRCEIRLCTQLKQQEVLVDLPSQPACQQQTQQPLSSNNNNERTFKRSRKKPSYQRQRKRKRSPSPEVFINPDLMGNRQCYGPSKYINYGGFNNF